MGLTGAGQGTWTVGRVRRFQGPARGHLLGLSLGAQGCKRAEGIPGPAAGAAAVGAQSGG